ncbi:T9SS type A sorting domain-containing protein [Flavobacteriales bacterium]|nr:T9SS type A sorting domain-containing protein [Flavobacteriales bacterium]
MKHIYTIGFALLGCVGIQNSGSAQAITHTIAEIQGELFSSPLIEQVVTTTGIVTANNVTSATSGTIGFFIQDGEGPWNGVYVYDNTQAPEIGDEIIIEAEVAEFYDVTELVNLTYYNVVSSDNALPAPMALTTGELAASEAHEGCLVQIINATCTVADADYGEAIFDDGSGEIKTNDYMYYPEDGWIAEQIYSITGCLHYTFEEYKIEPRNAADVVEGATNGLGDSHLPEQLGIYPNPAQDQIRLNSETPGQLRIHDAAGRTVLNQNILNAYPTIDVSSLDRGTYTVEFSSGQSHLVSQLLKH